MSGNAGADKGIRGEGDRLHLTICGNVEGVCPDSGKETRQEKGEFEKCYLTDHCNEMKNKTFSMLLMICK